MDGSHAKFGLHSDLGHLILRSARLVERRLDEALRPFGLTRIGWCILLVIAEERKRNPSDIASFIGIDRTAASRVLRQLEIEGLIARQDARGDRRRTNVSLTRRGRDRFWAAQPVCRQAMARIGADLRDAEVATLKDLLTRLRPPEDA